MSRNPFTDAASGVAELFRVDDEAQPRDFKRVSTDARRRLRDTERPDDDITEYRRLYETNPLISTPLDVTMDKVWEAGYYVTAATEEIEEELEEFSEQIGWIGGNQKQDLRQFGRDVMLSNYFVRGTFDGEKVVDDDGRHQGLYPLGVETLEAYTKPGKSILLAPSDTDKDNAETTEDGKAAAFIQFDDGIQAWGDRKERRFTREEVIHWPRKPDTNEVFGTSRIEHVYERALALEAKYRDNDDAIAMKAWPMVLFQLGSEERPWNKNEMTDFMDKYDTDEFGPGMYHGVPGDVEIQEFAGETADIDDAVTNDVDTILAGMPGPKFSLGAFNDDSVGNAVAASQERQFRQLVRGLRRDIEGILTQYYREVAVSWDLVEEGTDEYRSIELHVGRPQGDVAPEDINGNIVRYTSDVSPTQQDGPGGQASGPDGAMSDGEGGGSPDQGGPNAVPDMANLSSAELSARASPDMGMLADNAELADPRLVSTSSIVSTLLDIFRSLIPQVRDRLIDEVEGSGDVGQMSGDDLRRRAGQLFAEEWADLGGDRAARQQFDTVARDTLQTMRQPSHSPQISREFDDGFRDFSRSQVEAFRDDIRGVIGEIAESVRIQQATGGSWPTRVRSQYSQESTEQRLRVIAHMRAQRLVNNTKLSAYRDDARVVGVQLSNPCTSSTTPLCDSLACESDATAMFDDGEIGPQFLKQTEAGTVDGFTPLPTAPPYHYGCRTEVVPVLRDE
ncbi:hypothetical protein [Halosegnis longus]|uniref:hypothetical protein n=1 Tax=Halosegnis longus TaxID=2216012 RepID=UPI00129D46A3|nr:hypothetical protein [Halosegnis longus]